MRPRASISGLMMLVVFAALGSALTVSTVRLQPGPVRTLTALLLSLAVLGALVRRGRVRLFCLGIAMVGWGYFVPSCLILIPFPTNPSLLRVYEAVIGSPKVINPDDIVPFMRQVVDFLRVGHAILALFLGLSAGILCLALAIFFSLGGGKIRVAESRESSLPPQPQVPSLES